MLIKTRFIISEEDKGEAYRFQGRKNESREICYVKCVSDFDTKIPISGILAFGLEEIKYYLKI